MKSEGAKTEKEIDDLLKRIKKRTGFTQEQIADRIDYNRAYLSQAKKTDSEKLYNVLYKEFKDVLENLTNSEKPIPETTEPAKDVESLQSLSRAIEHLSSDKERTTALIERMFNFIERNFNSAPASKVGVVPSVNTRPADDPAFEDAELDKRVHGEKKGSQA